MVLHFKLTSLCDKIQITINMYIYIYTELNIQLKYIINHKC